MKVKKYNLLQLVIFVLLSSFTLSGFGDDESLVLHNTLNSLEELGESIIGPSPILTGTFRFSDMGNGSNGVALDYNSNIFFDRPFGSQFPRQGKICFQWAPQYAENTTSDFKGARYPFFIQSDIPHPNISGLPKFLFHMGYRDPYSNWTDLTYITILLWDEENNRNVRETVLYDLDFGAEDVMEVQIVWNKNLSHQASDNCFNLIINGVVQPISSGGITRNGIELLEKYLAQGNHHDMELLRWSKREGEAKNEISTEQYLSSLKIYNMDTFDISLKGELNPSKGEICDYSIETPQHVNGSDFEFQVDWGDGSATEWSTNRSFSKAWGDNTDYSVRVSYRVLGNDEAIFTRDFTISSYQGISTLEELQNIKNELNKNFRLLNDIDASSSEVEGFEPIGFNPNGDVFNPGVGAFCGKFSGAGFTISNLHISREEDEGVGLFGTCRGAVIEDVIIENPEVIGLRCVGGLVGSITDTEIRGIEVINPKLIGTTDHDEQRNHFGGIVGYGIDGNDKLISNCSVEGGELLGMSDIGGLAGTLKHYSITNCKTTEVKIECVENSGGCVGNFASGGAILNSKIYRCSVAGVNNIGGAVGVVTDSVLTTRTLIKGVISRYNDIHVAGGFAGGILGRNLPGIDIKESGALQNTISGNGSSILGGFIGVLGSNSVLEDSYVLGGNIIGNSSYYGGFCGVVNFVSNLRRVYSSLENIEVENGLGSLFIGEVKGYGNEIKDNYVILKDFDETWNIHGATLLSKELGAEVESFLGWDFDNVWKIKDTPRLQYETDFEIWTIKDLKYLSSHLSGNYSLMADIDLHGELFEPIGYGKPFTGSFDGNGHSIKNLTIDKASETAIGLFGFTDGAHIQDLTLDSPKVTGSFNVGALVGHAENSIVSKITIKKPTIIGVPLNESENIWSLGGCIGYSRSSNVSQVVVKNPNLFGQYDIGGLSGSNTDTKFSEVCVLDLNISAIGDNIGGLLGKVWKRESSDKTTVEDSYVLQGSITGVTSVGGAIGFDEAETTEVRNVYSAVDFLSGENYTGGFIGGLQYPNDRTINHCYWNNEKFANLKAVGNIENNFLGVTGVTGEYLKDLSASSEWDFENIWMMANYPHLQFEGVSVISYPEDIEKVRTNLQGTFYLDNNIILDPTGENNWVPIGSESAPFEGELHGGGYSINNLSVVTEGENYQGVFGKIENGLVKDIFLNNITIQGNNYVGVVAGDVLNGKIQNVILKGASVHGNESIGGIVGSLRTGSEILDCSVSHSNIMAKKFIGGIVGEISNSLVHRALVVDLSVRGEKQVGGVIGKGDSFKMFESPVISSRIRGINFIGGLAAQVSNSLIEDSYVLDTTIKGVDIVGGGIGYCGEEGNSTKEEFYRNYICAFNEAGDYIDIFDCDWNQNDDNTKIYLDNYVFVNRNSEKLKDLSMEPGLRYVSLDSLIEEDLSSESGDDSHVISLFLDDRWVKLGFPRLKYEKAFAISNIYDLQGIEKLPGGDFYMVDNIDASETSSWNNGTGFSPIPNFSGTFDGNGKILKNLFIDRTRHQDFENLQDCEEVGLCSVILKEGKISRLLLENVYVGGRDYVGSVAGINEGYIEQCGVEGNVSGSNAVGGLSGSNTGVIQNCYTNVQVQCENEGGGVAGVNGVNGDIHFTYAVGGVTGLQNIGGIVGKGDVENENVWKESSLYFYDNLKGTPHSIEEMQRMGTYTSLGWQFGHEAIWNMQVFPRFNFEDMTVYFGSFIVPEPAFQTKRNKPLFILDNNPDSLTPTEFSNSTKKAMYVLKEDKIITKDPGNIWVVWEGKDSPYVIRKYLIKNEADPLSPTATLYHTHFDDTPIKTSNEMGNISGDISMPSMVPLPQTEAPIVDISSIPNIKFHFNSNIPGGEGVQGSPFVNNYEGKLYAKGKTGLILFEFRDEGDQLIGYETVDIRSMKEIRNISKVDIGDQVKPKKPVLSGHLVQEDFFEMDITSTNGSEPLSHLYILPELKELGYIDDSGNLTQQFFLEDDLKLTKFEEDKENILKIIQNKVISNPIRPIIKDGLDLVNQSDSYLYQHENSASKQNGHIFAIKKTLTGEDIEIFWRKKSLGDVLWPYERQFYKADWPEANPNKIEDAKFQKYLRGSSPNAIGVSVEIPVELKTQLMPYQVPSSHAKLEGNIFSTDISSYHGSDLKEGPFWSLLQYLPGNDVSFQVVKSVFHDVEIGLKDKTDAKIGEEVVYTKHETHEAPSNKPGYIYVKEQGENSPKWDRYDPVVYHGTDSIEGTGQIFPVNTWHDESGTDQGILEVWWYELDKLSNDKKVQWPVKPIQYHIKWPNNSSEIIIASQKGSSLGSIQVDDFKTLVDMTDIDTDKGEVKRTKFELMSELTDRGYIQSNVSLGNVSLERRYDFYNNEYVSYSTDPLSLSQAFQKAFPKLKGNALETGINKASTKLFQFLLSEDLISIPIRGWDFSGLYSLKAKQDSLKRNLEDNGYVLDGEIQEEFFEINAMENLLLGDIYLSDREEIYEILKVISRKAILSKELIAYIVNEEDSFLDKLSFEDLGLGDLDNDEKEAVKRKIIETLTFSLTSGPITPKCAGSDEPFQDIGFLTHEMFEGFATSGESIIGTLKSQGLTEGDNNRVPDVLKEAVAGTFYNSDLQLDETSKINKIIKNEFDLRKQFESARTTGLVQEKFKNLVSSSQMKMENSSGQDKFEPYLEGAYQILKGSYDLQSGTYSNWELYYQNNPEEAGFNPNDEHAIVSDLGGNPTIFALRSDLFDEEIKANETFGYKTSRPYVLMKYQKRGEAKWNYRIFEVKAETEEYPFRYPMVAGKRVSIPYPLETLGVCENNYSAFVDPRDPAWKDRKNQYWARSAKDNGDKDQIDLRFYYRNQPSFYYPDSYVMSDIIDEEVPFLNWERKTIKDDVPYSVKYDVYWPDDVTMPYPLTPKILPTLRVGETLVKQKFGLPNICEQSSAQIIFQQNNKKIVKLIDPTEKREEIIARIPDDVQTEVSKGMVYFPTLPPHLRKRFYIDPTDPSNMKLVFKGEFVDAIGAEEPSGYTLLNTIFENGKDYDTLNSLSKNDEYIEAVGGLLKTCKNLDVVSKSSPFFDSLALTAGDAQGKGYVTVVFGNNSPPSGVAEPISVEVIKVDGKYRGEIKAIESDNPFDEKITLRHTGDFAGELGNFEFQWRYSPPEEGSAPTVVRRSNNGGAGWIAYPDSREVYPDITIKPEGDGATFCLRDNYLICRYRPKLLNGSTADEPESRKDTWEWDESIEDDNKYRWSDWTEPMLAQGWMKRVLNGIEPFEQRIKDFENSEVDTTVSMISQAGARWIGNVALNLESAQNNGLIEIYESVLNRGLEIVSSNTIEERDSAVDDALLLAAGRISDLYMLLGNEAYADASDPTIAFGTEGQYGAEAASIHCFMNQTSSLLEEELALLRGRDDDLTPDTRTYPFYNKLIWNFTNDINGGEVAYALNYNIRDKDGDIEGKVNEDDARKLYPQGHGDAWGHYLTSVKGYYRLLSQPSFKWEPRIEAVLVAGVPVNVDYLDERKFAKSAAARAKVGSEIVNLTYRANYTEDPKGQWQGYKDEEKSRAWGVSEWAQRSGQGAFIDWVIANAILPEATEVVGGEEEIINEDLLPRYFSEGTKKYDELFNLLSTGSTDQDDPIAPILVFKTKEGVYHMSQDYKSVESDIDDSAKDKRKIWFKSILDLDDSFSLDEIYNSFEILESFLYAFENKKEGIMRIDRGNVPELKIIHDSYQEVQSQLDNADNGLNPLGLAKNALPFDIDPSGISQGKTHFEQIYGRAVSAMNNAISVFNHASNSSQLLRRQSDSVDEFKKAVENREADFNSRLIEIYGTPYTDDMGPMGIYESDYEGPDLYHFAYVDRTEITGLPTPPTTKMTLEIKEYEVQDEGKLKEVVVPITFNVDKHSLEIVKPENWNGVRQATGEVQRALSTLMQQRVAFKKELQTYKNLILDIESQSALIEKMYGINDEMIEVVSIDMGLQLGLSTSIQIFKQTYGVLERSAELSENVHEAVAGAYPTSIGFSPDLTGPLRLVEAMAGALTSNALKASSLLQKVLIGIAEVGKEASQYYSGIQLRTLGNDKEMLSYLKQLEQQVRQEAVQRIQLYNSYDGIIQSVNNYRSILAKGQRVLADRTRFRKQTATKIQGYRYHDMAFRIFRNDTLQKYRAQFDLAAKYVYLAAKAYDFETNLLPGDERGPGEDFLNEIVKSRALGQIVRGLPQAGSGFGDAGLADPLARMSMNWNLIIKGQLGFNNPQNETGRFSLRKELFRILPGQKGDETWRELLSRKVVDNLMDVPEFKRYCIPFSPHLPQEPGIVLEFATDVNFGENFFGWPAVGGDNSYDSTHFATKIRSQGVWFSNYNNLGEGISNTPRIYLFPVGKDILRSPTDNSGLRREWQILDQKLPVPFPLSENDLAKTDWMPAMDTLYGDFIDIRKYPAFRAYHDSGNFNQGETISNSRLIGRSVANTKWLMIIPAGTLHVDRNEGLNRFIHGRLKSDGERDGNGVKDIKLFFQTYSFSGN